MARIDSGSTVRRLLCVVALSFVCATRTVVASATNKGQSPVQLYYTPHDGETSPHIGRRFHLAPLAASNEKSQRTTFSHLCRGGAIVRGANVDKVKPGSRAVAATAAPTNPLIHGDVVAPPTQTAHTAITTTYSLRIVYAVSFLVFLSSSLVALSPVQALQQRLDASRATQVLSALSATAALLEITTSSMVGSLLDVTGRKPALVTIVATLVLINAGTSLVPTVVTICAQKLVNMLAIGFFFLTSQTILSDIVTRPSTLAQNDGGTSVPPLTTTSSLVSAAMGRQLALTGLGFLLGILGAGVISDFGLPVVYGIASCLGMVALVLIQWGLGETMPERGPSDGAPTRWLVLQSPLSCTRLLTRHGPRVRTLGILLMLMTLPVFMGDFFQIFARQEWQLSTRSFSTFLALFGTVGIVANTVGSVLVKAWGIKTFTTVAVLSKLFTTVATVGFGYHGSIVGLILGFLGSAQSIGIVAALIAEAAKSGLPMGEMAGERASLMALLKVFGPIWYSTLYLQGQQWMHTSYLPFVFNIGLCLVALVISHLHL